MIQASEK